jgi:hypothetical protein
MIVIIEHWQGRRTMVVFPEMPVLKWCVPVCEVLLMDVERRQRAADDQGYRRDECEDVSDQSAPHRAIMVKRLQDVNERFSGHHERFQDVNDSIPIRSQGVGSNVDGGLTTSTWSASQAPCRWTAVSTTGRV